MWSATSRCVISSILPAPCASAGCSTLFPTRLRNFARLPRVERSLALRALAWIVIVRAGLKLLSFTRLRSLTAPPVRRPHAAGAVSPAMVRRAVLRASRSLPGTTCLAQSLVAERLLRAAGRDATLSIGVAAAVIDGAPSRAPGKPIDAHAWVESEGLLVTGDDPHERYQRLATLGPA
jgi:hypothetical protein